MNTDHTLRPSSSPASTSTSWPSIVTETRSSGEYTDSHVRLVPVGASMRFPMRYGGSPADGASLRRSISAVAVTAPVSASTRAS